MALDILKSLLPNRPVPTRIRCGPFRGARIVMNPRDSLRKIIGIYEHELNPWIEQALRRVTRVLDVGANDGYFTFGSAAAFRRMGKTAEIVGYEPDAGQVQKLRESIAAQGRSDIRFEIVQAFVGRQVGEGVTTLDALPAADRRNTLIKIDVEGAEVEVLEGTRSWIDGSNLFLIEVHEERFLEQINKLFAARAHTLVQINQRPVPLLGREARGEKNWWLVSELQGGGKNR